MVLSDTQLGNMALRAKQQRTKAEQDKQLLQNRINRLIIEQEQSLLARRDQRSRDPMAIYDQHAPSALAGALRLVPPLRKSAELLAVPEGVPGGRVQVPQEADPVDVHSEELPAPPGLLLSPPSLRL